MFQPANPLSLGFFVFFALVMFATCYRALCRVSNPKLWIGPFIGLILIFSLLALSGIISRAFIPFGPAIFALTILVGVLFSFSKETVKLIDSLSLAVLIGFQGFRLPLELILHDWATSGTIPVAMTWTGQNWDIATGVLSIFAIPFVGKSKTIAIIVNTIGFLLLMNVLRVVVLSSPVPFGWPLEKPLLLVAHFPYCLIVPLFVLPAFIGHLLTFRKIGRA